jgi:hypothetical protein
MSKYQHKEVGVLTNITEYDAKYDAILQEKYDYLDEHYQEFSGYLDISNPADITIDGSATIAGLRKIADIAEKLYNLNEEYAQTIRQTA